MPKPQYGGQYVHEILHNAASATADGEVLECTNGEEGNYGLVSVQITGTFTATITFEGTVDGSTWVAMPFRNRNSGAWATTATAAGIYEGSVAGLLKFRARLTWTSGTSITATALMSAVNDLKGSNLTYLAAGTNNIGDVDVLSIAAGENLVGLVGSPDTYLTLTPTLDTSAYTAGDALFDATELASVGRTSGGNVVLQSVTVMDKADQKLGITLYFFDRSVTFGTANNAPSISDADGFFYMGHVDIAAGDYDDLGGVAVAVARGLGLQMKPNATSLYVAATTGGTPTYGASDLKFGFGFLRS